MPKTSLTDLAVKNFSVPVAGQVTYWDQKLSGFGCRVSQGGQKTFIVMHGPRDARRRKVVGKYPVNSLKEARAEARKALAKLALGLPEEATANLTFDAARDRYLDYVKKRNRPRTHQGYKRLLATRFQFGKKRLADITRNDIQRCLAKLQNTPSEMEHARVVVRIFFNWAYREELIDRNPTDRLQKTVRCTPRERVLSDAELGEVLHKAQEYPWPYGPIVMLCILTGQRRGEIGMLQWDWINQKERTITLPGDQVKNGQTHTFPYGEMTTAVLSSIPHTGQYLFSGRNEGNATFNGWSKCKKRFDAKLTDVAHYTLHDLRRTFSTMHAKIGTPIHVTERLLNHVSGSISGVAAIYNRHSYLAEMRDAIEKSERYLSENRPVTNS